jgi:hypothetical protein
MQTQRTENEIPNWAITVDYVETCNCDYGCPCNFVGFPTYGFCRALCLYDITKGNYGGVKLDELQVVEAYNWPKAIHQGDGTMQMYFTKKANPEQRKALEEIFYGRAKGERIFCDFCGHLQIQT